MTITAKVIADSVSAYGIRLTTLQLRYPRFIHSEFMTHRVFSRNASSSRAVPVKRLIDDVMRDPAMPIHWGANQPGMQATGECDNKISLSATKSYTYGNGEVMLTNKEAWLEARDRAVEVARSFASAGYHKQLVNRLLEPFSHINVVVTATEWSNFFALRNHADAQPEIKALAEAMLTAMDNNTPTFLEFDEWHLPYITHMDRGAAKTRNYYGGGSDPNTALIQASVARCARVSYLTFDEKEPKFEDDLALYTKLVGSAPLHASPAEHQAAPDQKVKEHWMNPHLHANFVGWRQFRKTLPNENQ